MQRKNNQKSSAEKLLAFIEADGVGDAALKSENISQYLEGCKAEDLLQQLNSKHGATTCCFIAACKMRRHSRRTHILDSIIQKLAQVYDLKTLLNQSNIANAVLQQSTDEAFARLYDNLDLKTYGDDVLYAAIRHKNPDAVKFVLDSHQVDVNKPELKISPLVFALFQGAPAELIAHLIAANADVNVTQADGMTPLMLACERYDLETIKLLLSKKADVNAKAANGITSLKLALMYNKDAVGLLLEHGANTNASTADELTPLELACQYHPDAIPALVEHKAEVNANTSQRRKHLEVDANTSQGMKHLEFALRKGYNDAVKYLVAAGADINISSKEGERALHLASKYCSTDTVLTLIHQDPDFRHVLDIKVKLKRPTDIMISRAYPLYSPRGYFDAMREQNPDSWKIIPLYLGILEHLEQGNAEAAKKSVEQIKADYKDKTAISILPQCFFKIPYSAFKLNLEKQAQLINLLEDIVKSVLEMQAVNAQNVSGWTDFQDTLKKLKPSDIDVQCDKLLETAGVVKRLPEARMRKAVDTFLETETGQALGEWYTTRLMAKTKTGALSPLSLFSLEEKGTATGDKRDLCLLYALSQNANTADKVLDLKDVELKKYIETSGVSKPLNDFIVNIKIQEIEKLNKNNSADDRYITTLPKIGKN